MAKMHHTEDFVRQSPPVLDYIPDLLRDRFVSMNTDKTEVRPRLPGLSKGRIGGVGVSEIDATARRPFSQHLQLEPEIVPPMNGVDGLRLGRTPSIRMVTQNAGARMNIQSIAFLAAGLRIGDTSNDGHILADKLVQVLKDVKANRPSRIDLLPNLAVYLIPAPTD